MANSSNGSQINALTATRAVAAILVFIHHFGTGVFPFNKAVYFFSSGNIAVGYFFVLSGFVLYISYSNKDISYSSYISKRIGRIVPVYWIALLLAVLAGVIYYSYNWHSWQAFREFTYSALFIQAWIPSYPMCLNGPGWTISIEMFFYFIFPFLLLLQKKNLKIFAALTVVLYTLAQYFHLKYYPDRHSLPDNIVDTVFFNPVMHINQFMIGMIGAYLYGLMKNKGKNLKWLPFVLFAVIVFLIAERPENISYQVGLISPIFMVFIISIALCQPRVLNYKPLVYLGEISYGIYILQQPVYKLAGNFNTLHLHIPPDIFFWLALLLLIAIASFSYNYIEVPLKRKITGLKLR